MNKRLLMFAGLAAGVSIWTCGAMAQVRDAAPSTVAPGDSLPAPEMLRADANSHPFWIAAAAATTSTGEVNYSVFDTAFRDIVRSQAVETPHAQAHTSGSSSEPCTQFTIAFNEGPAKATATWRDAVSNASAIAIGTVTAVTSGFFGTSPGTLLTVRLKQVIRKDASVRIPAEIFLPYMAADFTIGGSRFCNAGRLRSGESFLPAINDDVLTFIFVSPNGHYVAAADENVFFGRRDHLYAPATFANDRTLPVTTSFKALVKSVRSEAAHPTNGVRR